MDKLDINGNKLLAGSQEARPLEADVVCGSSETERERKAELFIPSTVLPSLRRIEDCQSRDATVESIPCLEYTNRRWSLFGKRRCDVRLSSEIRKELSEGLAGARITARTTSFSVAVRQRHQSSQVSAFSRGSLSLDESEDCQPRDTVVERVSGLNSEDCLQYGDRGLLGQVEYGVPLSAKTSEDAQEGPPGPRIAAKTSSFSAAMRLCHQSSQVPASSKGSSPLNVSHQCTGAAVDSTGGLNDECYLEDTPYLSTSPKTSTGPFSEGAGNCFPPLESAGWLFGILTNLTQKIASGCGLSTALQSCRGLPPEKEHYFGDTDCLVDKG